MTASGGVHQEEANEEGEARGRAAKNLQNAISNSATEEAAAPA
jgi:hypothetical protein